MSALKRFDPTQYALSVPSVTMCNTGGGYDDYVAIFGDHLKKTPGSTGNVWYYSFSKSGEDVVIAYNRTEEVFYIMPMTAEEYKALVKSDEYITPTATAIPSDSNYKHLAGNVVQHLDL